ncbi:MAG: hypothetical protein Q4P32_04220 [Micrococcales bacterium]|nr:hypothetical protein [Micrococcales bacterium]
METTPRSSVDPRSGVTVSLPVIEWRRRRLVASGFEASLADHVARSHIDLHELLALLDRGCPPDLAVRILAPIERMALPSLGSSPLSPVSPWPPNSTVAPTPRGSAT